jgi:hypothetical protein
MSAKRDEAAKILDRIPKSPEGIRSDTQPVDFFNWTGYKHSDMLASWRENKKGPKLLTACGGFASKFAGLIGITDIASFFDLEKSLIDAGKAHAWVPASSGAYPQVGDILRHTVFHVDVAAGWAGNTVGGKLIRVAAGQSYHPRPTESVEGEFDRLMWVTGKSNYNPANLQGWLDLDLYFGPAPASVGPAIGWLNGWWKVWDGNTYYYFFGPGGVAQYTKTPPPNTSGPPKRATNVGRYTNTPPNEVVIRWNQVAGAEAACQETFYNAAPGCRQMNATSNLYSPLVATRLS